MSQPTWAQRARDRGLNLEEVSQGVFIVTKTDNQPLWEGAAQEEGNSNLSDEHAAPQDTPEEANSDDKANQEA